MTGGDTNHQSIHKKVIFLFLDKSVLVNNTEMVKLIIDSTKKMHVLKTYRLYMNWIQMLKFVSKCICINFYRGRHFADLAFISSFSTPSMSRMKQELFILGTT